MSAGRQTPGQIYFVAPLGGGRIKIGWSSCPVRRLKGLLLWSPVDLEILAAAPGTPEDENFLHDCFRSQWCRREWFEPSDCLLKLIAAVHVAGALPSQMQAPTGWQFKRMPGQGKPGSSDGQRRVWASMTPAERQRRGRIISIARKKVAA